MNNPLGVSPSKGRQGTTRGKEKSFDLGGNRTHDFRIRSTVTLPTELQGRTEKAGDDFMNVVPRSTRNTSTSSTSSTLIYTSELILCSPICVPSATRHNIHMYPYFLFAAIHHLKSSPAFSVRPCSSVGRVTVDLIRRSWVRFPPRSKDFFFASCGSLFPFTRANAQWVIHGFK